MVDIIEPVLAKQLSDCPLLGHVPIHKLAPCRHLVEETTGEVIDHDHPVPQRQAVLSYMTPDETSTACDERHWPVVWNFHFGLPGAVQYRPIRHRLILQVAFHGHLSDPHCLGVSFPCANRLRLPRRY